MAVKRIGSLLCWLCLTLMTVEAAAEPSQHRSQEPSPAGQTVNFWNGNKTEARQQYEREVLKAVMNATVSSHGEWHLKEDLTDYPKASDEAAVFRMGYDLFVTVAGNKKLADEDKIIIPMPLMKGLLGYRLLIINAKDRKTFSGITSAEQLQKLRMGIPETWADADLFRHNGYKVVERGDFDDLFNRLLAGEFDYAAFGANEIEGVFANRAKPKGNFVIDQSLLVYYPFPLVFYVNPEKPQLVARVREGLRIIQQNGKFDAIFDRFYGETVEQLNLKERRLIVLDNPILPKSLQGMEAELISPAKKSMGSVAAVTLKTLI